MKSVDSERQLARRFAVGAACASVIIGFIACSGASEHRASPHQGVGGDAAGGAAQAGTAATGPEQGGSESTQAGQRNGGAPSTGGDAGAAGQTIGGVGGASSGGAAGQTFGGVGGESSGGVGGESSGGAGGAGGDPGIVDPVCGLNMIQVGQYSLWCGKVNEHTNADGLWIPDADCSSGCNVTGVSYCQKFYPSATAVQPVPQVDTKDWKNAGCADSTPDGPGVSGQAACCAPIQ